MAKLKAQIQSYDDCAAFMRSNCNSMKKLGHNTYVVRFFDDEGDGKPMSYGIRLYCTDVVLFFRDGKIKLFSGGHRTYTTKQRINAVLPDGVCVYQHKHEWFVSDRFGSHPFKEGFTIDPKQPDVEVEYHGSVSVVTPLSMTAKKFFAEHVHYEAYQRWNEGIAIDWRPARDLVEAMRGEHGLVVAVR